MNRASFFLLLTALCTQATPIYLATDQTGAQTQVDVNHTSSWIMTPTSNFDLGGGVFVMKAGNSTSATVVLTLYQGTSSSGTLLGSVTLTNTAFCLQANCGQFNQHQFLFSSPFSLVAGTTYYADLTSSANDVQSQAYFIKNDFYFMSDITGTALPSQPVTFGMPSGGGGGTPAPAPAPEPVPEPGTAGLLAAAGLALAAGARSRSTVS